MFDELISQIAQLLATKLVVVVAISGFGGAGKSTLADRLRDHLDIADAQVIRIDGLYSENPNGPHMLDQVDWSLLERILKGVQEGKRLEYVGRDSRGESIHIDENLPRVVIVEGIRLLQPKLMPYFDIAVWIDCPHEIAIERAKVRDRSQGDDEETVARWDTDWGVKDKAYFDAYNPRQLATFVFTSSSTF